MKMNDYCDCCRPIKPIKPKQPEYPKDKCSECGGDCHEYPEGRVMLSQCVDCGTIRPIKAISKVKK